jgi:hypothetical protein
MYVRLVQLIDGATSRRRTLLKLQIRRAAQGTEKRPGDWRAAQALGSITDPGEFVPQIRVHVERQIDAVLNGLHEAFKNEPELLARALHAVIGSSAPAANAPEDPLAPPEPITDPKPG